MFGVGGIENGKPICRHFKEEFYPEIAEGEILIKAELCLLKPEEGISDQKIESYITKIQGCETIESIGKIEEEIARYSLSPDQNEKLKNEINRKKGELKGIAPPATQKYHNINLKLNVPSGKLSDIVRIVNYVRSKFTQVNMRIEISVQDGEIAISEYEDKIREAINQAGVRVEQEEVE